MKIAIGGDHAGFGYKKELIPKLEKWGYTVTDFGTSNEDSVDYPDFAHPVAQAVESGECEIGILICGTGNGVAITANKHQKIRAGLCWNEEVASLIRQHNDANVLSMPARFITLEEAEKITKTFLTTAFEGGRHARRVEKMIC
ncbi:MAG: ribose 5-phosphate isomerase B [Flammeovirgaceae bacterium]|nr:ribose 5-phosphate isomerase B [Flammeovirgaceae bacterium]